MKLNIQEAQRLFSYLKSFNGQEVVVRNTDLTQSERTLIQPFDMKPKGRWNLAKNIAVLKKHIDAYVETHNQLIATLSGGKNQLDETDEKAMATYNETLKLMENDEPEIAGLLAMNPADLYINVEESELPQGAYVKHQPGNITGIMCLLGSDPV